MCSFLRPVLTSSACSLVLRLLHNYDCQVSVIVAKPKEELSVISLFIVLHFVLVAAKMHHTKININKLNYNP